METARGRALFATYNITLMTFFIPPGNSLVMYSVRNMYNGMSQFFVFWIAERIKHVTGRGGGGDGSWRGASSHSSIISFCC